ncbi:MAG: glutamine-synthetase adenylyltransferase [Marinosulfonomonas sp.]
MSFENHITRSPQPFDISRGQDIASQFSELAPDVAGVLAGTAGSSPYLAGLINSESDWLRDALAKDPDALRGELLSDARSMAAADLASGLRAAKRRVALYTALCDLAGVWPLEKVTGTLTDFADLAVDLAIKHFVGTEIDRGKLPGATDADKDSAGGMSVLAMGKMGAGELNYSSDIDLIVLFDETRFDPEDYGEARASFIRATRRAMAALSDITRDGYVFRTDLRLRPDASVTPVCLSMEAAERYYESVGRTWERAAYIKARACAGDIAAGQGFLERLRPFIWRKHLDFASIQDAHDMRLRIRDHKGLHGDIVLEGHNMKLGAGGIREIEFFTQTRQIIAGGRDETLRSPNTVEGLAQLAAKGWVDPEDAAQLTQDYRAHRETEHRIQMVNDAQTHDLPKSPEGFERLAALSGLGVEDMRSDILDRLNRVAQLTEGFFTPQESDAAQDALSPDTQSVIDRWRTYAALRSDRAVEIFERLKPELLRRLQSAARPEEALAQFDRFLAGLPAGVQVFSLFEANPQLIDLIVDIAATAPELAQYLGHNAQVFDAVIGGDFFAPWPGREALTQDLQRQLSKVSDYEGRLDLTRRWRKEWHFRVGVHHLRGLINGDEAGAEYAALADAVLNALWPVVVDNFAEKHGPPPGVGAAILGMGSLGSERLTASSDLDVIIVYDAAGEESSEGRRPLNSRTYYARLTQALVTALSAPMAEGRLYEVDMRLRPSGRQGPVATSFDAFCTYQRDQAWTWEHLALTRARQVAGADALGQRIETFRKGLLLEKGDAVATLKDVRDMRQRIASAKTGGGPWEAKTGAGRMQDIELFAQTAALLAGDPARGVLDQLASGVAIGWLTEQDQQVLQQAYALMSNLQSATRLLCGEVLDFELVGVGGTDLILRETGADSVEALAGSMAELSQAAADVIGAALGRPPRLP